ncbi:venom metalloproteinase antarease-like TtrivMP_A [Rhipicephalus sanguineus]|uniref:venom metalloproteinase antarease-like TtrivMP_A n=1 Tax=Rhipicephalus sanguineus TaxID=34632 RepID=UPI0020C38252|nr:venom metalloproteinase antarease-like TtrivMP_A [Rhipicephalus sanguineus]
MGGKDQPDVTGKGLYDVPIIYPEVRVVADSTFMAGFKSYKYLVKYLMIEFNCINLRYRTATRPKMRIWFRSVDVTVKSKETYYSFRYGNVIDGLKSLYNLVEYVDKREKKFGRYDIVFFVTGLDMAAVEGSRVETALQGFAFVGSVCLRTRVGLGEDKADTFIGIRIIAHELAHTLGCSHDGTTVDAHIKGIKADSARCPWETGYLMSYIEENANSMKFSSCCDYSMSLVAWPVTDHECKLLEFGHPPSNHSSRLCVVKDVSQGLMIREDLEAPAIQMDDLTERLNRTLSDMFSMYVAADHTKWDAIVPFVTYAYNAAPQSTSRIDMSVHLFLP